MKFVGVSTVLVLVFVLCYTASVQGQWGLQNMMWPSSGGINAQLGMAPPKVATAPVSCSTGDLKFAYSWKYGQDSKVALNKCCRGYVRHGDRCISACSEPCESGECTGVDQCSCREGFQWQSQFKCIPLCDGGCPNGTSCLAPNVCGCLDGFRWSDRTERCESDPRAQCEARCVNGFCEPAEDGQKQQQQQQHFRCRCNPGFRVTEEDENGAKCLDEVLICMHVIRRGKLCLTRRMTFTSR